MAETRIYIVSVALHRLQTVQTVSKVCEARRSTFLVVLGNPSLSNMSSNGTRRQTPLAVDALELWPRAAVLSAYPSSAPRMPMTLRKRTIPTMTTATKRKIRNQKQPL